MFLSSHKWVLLLVIIPVKCVWFFFSSRLHWWFIFSSLSILKVNHISWHFSATFQHVYLGFTCHSSVWIFPALAVLCRRVYLRATNTYAHTKTHKQICTAALFCKAKMQQPKCPLTDKFSILVQWNITWSF